MSPRVAASSRQCSGQPGLIHHRTNCMSRLRRSLSARHDASTAVAVHRAEGSASSATWSRPGRVARIGTRLACIDERDPTVKGTSSGADVAQPQRRILSEILLEEREDTVAATPAIATIRRGTLGWRPSGRANPNCGPVIRDQSGPWVRARSPGEVVERHGHGRSRGSAWEGRNGAVVVTEHDLGGDGSGEVGQVAGELDEQIVD